MEHMSEDKNNKKNLGKDFSQEPENKIILNNDTSEFVKESIFDTNNDELFEDINKISGQKIDSITEANESLITMDPAPFDQTLELMSQTLASIDAKIGIENSQLQKLSQLSEIKNQLNRLENISVAPVEVALEPQATTEATNKIEEDMPLNNIGHNQQEISELLEKMNILEKKILTFENKSNNSSERLENIESVVKRFEDLEIELPNLFKNLFKKKKKINQEEKNFDINKSEIQSEKTQTLIPKDTSNIIEEAEDSLKYKTNETLILENTNNEILINDDFKEDFFKEDKKPKLNILKYVLCIFLFLAIIIAILFSLNKFQIIDLNFDEVTSSAFSLVDLFLKKLIFYFNLNDTPLP